MGSIHGGSQLSIKNIPISLDENTYSYITFDENLVGGANSLVPVGINDYIEELFTKGKFQDGIQVKDNSNIYLKYKLAQEVNLISFWFKTDNSTKVIVNGSTPRTLLSQHIDDRDPSLGYWMCYIGRTGEPNIVVNKLSLEVHTDSASYKCYVNDVNPLDGQWHFITIELNRQSDTITSYSSRLSIDGIFSETELTKGSGIGYSLPIKPEGFFRVGHFDETESDAMAECLIDEICLRYGDYSKEEITRWHISNSQFYDPYNYIDPYDSDKVQSVKSLIDSLTKTWDDVDDFTWDQVDDGSWDELRLK